MYIVIHIDRIPRSEFTFCWKIKTCVNMLNFFYWKKKEGKNMTEL